MLTQSSVAPKIGTRAGHRMSRAIRAYALNGAQNFTDQTGNAITSNDVLVQFAASPRLERS